ncbi:MAG: phosphatase PAP2 family protein [Desulfobacterales bacterium]
MLEKINFSGVGFLIVMIITISSLWGLVEFADRVTEKETQNVDQLILRILRESDQPIHSSDSNWLQSAVRDITSLGGYAVLALVVVVSGGYFILKRNNAPAIHLFAVLAVGTWVCNFLKVLFSRPRPDIEHMVYVASYSFPSGHAMLSASVYLTLAILLVHMETRRQIKIYLLSLAVLMTLLVGLSRIYLGVHYLTDVLAGWLAGTAWALICLLIAQYLQRNRSNN